VFALALGAGVAGCGARSDLTCYGGLCSLPDGLVPDEQAPGPDEDPTGAVPDPDEAPGAGGSFTGLPTPPRADEGPPSVVIPPSEPTRGELCPTGGDVSGDIVITNEEDLEDLSGCLRLQGNLTLVGFTSDLTPLRSLREVSGVLSIGTSGTLTGLGSLEHAGVLAIEDADVPSLEPLSALRTLGNGQPESGGLVVSKIPRLRNLDGLRALTELTRVEVSQNPVLTSLRGLSFPARLAEVRILDNPALETIQALRTLTRAGLVEIRGTASVDVRGLENLNADETTALALINNPNMTDLEELGSVVSLGLLRVEGLAVASLDDLVSLRSAQNIILEANPNLLQVDALGPVNFEKLSVNGNPSLQRLPVFTAVTALQQAYVHENAALTNGPAFSSLSDIDILTVQNNPSLRELDGFSTVRTVRSLFVVENRSLGSLGFGALENVRTLRIICNTTLPEDSLASLRQVSSSTQVHGNLGSDSSSCTP
jgi:hypothetical protein